jgi:crossover junction endodeoxyribonuclease RuvC
MSMQPKNSIIMGIDPGTRVTGYGIIEIVNNSIKPLDYGCIRPPSNADLEIRYMLIYDSLLELIKRYSPTDIAVESQFVKKNAQSAIKLGMAKGMVLLAAAKSSTPIYEYAPKKAKLAVVGQGSASKEQVQKMIQVLLHLSCLPTPEDASDGLALAICHAHTLSFKNRIVS